MALCGISGDEFKRYSKPLAALRRVGRAPLAARQVRQARIAANGFSAFTSPADPKPAIVIKSGRVASMDGVLAHDFDMIDAFIARHHIDPEDCARGDGDGFRR